MSSLAVPPSSVAALKQYYTWLLTQPPPPFDSPVLSHIRLLNQLVALQVALFRYFPRQAEAQTLCQAVHALGQASAPEAELRAQALALLA